MSTPTQPMPNRTEGAAVHAEIRSFVAAVERALDDLPAEDVAELAGGLEADLTEAWVTEGTTPAQRFGTPEAYAAELRAAAGLPARSSGTTSRGLRGAIRAVVRDGRSTVTGLPGWPVIRDLGMALRPVWWALRGYAAYLVAVESFTRSGVEGHALPGSGEFQLLLAVPVVLSVELGRRGARLRNVVGRGLLVSVNAVALIALFVLIGPASSKPWLYDMYVNGSLYDSGTVQPSGLVNDDYQVVNVFPYDAEGKPLEGVQLFDDRGRPLEIDRDNRGYLSGDGATYRKLVPGIGEDAQQRWNVFPMRELQTVDPDGDLTQDGAPRDAVRPDPTQQPLLDMTPKPAPKSAEDK